MLDADVEAASDAAAAVRICQALSQRAWTGEDWLIELALLGSWVADFELAIEYAETEEQIDQAREAIEAAKALSRAITALRS